MTEITQITKVKRHRAPRSFLVALMLAALVATALGQQARRPEFEPVKDDPGLPRVLVIGDSISIGYTLPLRAALKGIANVHRPPENCQHTWRGLEAIDDWLGEGKWDLIHFNWGLHDLKYVDATGRRALPQSASLTVDRTMSISPRNRQRGLPSIVPALSAERWLQRRSEHQPRFALLMLSNPLKGGL